MSEWSVVEWSGYPFDCYDYQSTCCGENDQNSFLSVFLVFCIQILFTLQNDNTSNVCIRTNMSVWKFDKIINRPPTIWTHYFRFEVLNVEDFEVSPTLCRINRSPCCA